MILLKYRFQELSYNWTLDSSRGLALRTGHRCGHALKKMRILKRLHGAIYALLPFGSVCLPLVSAQTPLSFVAIAPCRVADTRLAPGIFGGPSLASASTRSFPIPASSCNIPANAAAYSLNITGVPMAFSSIGYLEVWPAGQTQPLVSTLNVPIANALANAAIVAAGTNGAINVYVSNASDVVIDINGYFVAQTSPGSDSTALGTGASNAGSQNTAIGFNSLQVNGSGNANTGIGSLALSSNTSGDNNVALGSSALQFNAMGAANTALGTQSLLNNLLGSNNSAVGFNSLWQNTVGTNNTALGASALFGNSSGSWNIAIGSEAGQSLSGSYNIDIGNQGQANDSSAIRIGSPSNQSSAYIAGIYNVNVGTGAAVMINSNGQLGTTQSSRRYKEDIQDMGTASNGLMRLRPVTFRYKKPLPDGSKPLQYGLIGEEVEKVFPELVIYGSDRQVDSIAYHELPSLLLNELQNQHRTIQQQTLRISEQAEQLHLLKERIDALEKLVQEK